MSEADAATITLFVDGRPVFAEVAQEMGIGTLLSCPLFLPADDVVATAKGIVMARHDLAV